MSIGPVELVVIKFPGNQFKGEIIPALRHLVENRTIRIIDILFVIKDDAGELTAVEINDLDEEDYAVFDPIVSDITALLSHDDVAKFAGALENNSSAAIM